MITKMIMQVNLKKRKRKGVQVVKKIEAVLLLLTLFHS